MAAEKLPGLILVSSHAEMVSQGKKTIFIKSEQFKRYVDQEVFVVADGKAFAKITFAKPVKIDLKKFKAFRNRHKVTEDERKKWWPKKRTLYSYKIRLLEGFSTPIAAIYPTGPQVFVKEVVVEIPVEKEESADDSLDSFEESFVIKRSGLMEDPAPLGAKRLEDYIPDLPAQEIENVITGETNGGSRPRHDRPPRAESPPPPKSRGLKSRVARRREILKNSSRVTIQEPKQVKEIRKKNDPNDLLSKFKKKLAGG